MLKTVARPSRALPFVVALLLLFSPLPAEAAEALDHPVAGHWEGEIVLPTGELQVMVDLTLGEEGWQGTIDIPQQGASDLPLADIEVGGQGESVKFSIAGIPGNPTFDGALGEGELTGSFTQGGAQLTFRLGREAVEPPKRPQDPEPPFPYDEEEVTYENGDITLAGTLTLPPGDGPFPAAVLITGSGPQNRNEELLGHRPFLVLADHLARQGIAVLRADDRGVGGSSGDVNQSTSSDFADDALAGVALLAADPRIDRGKIGLIGHSEGGLVAPLAATRSDDVAFIVLLAGPGVPGTEILVLQVELIARASGMPEESIEEQVTLIEEALSLITGGRPQEEIMPRLMEIGRRQMELAGELPEEDEALNEAIETQIARLATPWFEYFLTYDPAATLARVEVPVLAVNGALDTQVDAEQNLPPILAALAEAGNLDVTVRALPGLNHLFQHATTGAPGEYGQIEETMAPQLLGIVAGWIVERFGEAAEE